MLDSATGCRPAIVLEPRKTHHFAIVAVGAQSARQRPHVAQSHIAMTWTPTATRTDVIRMVARYVNSEFSIRSTAGKLVIDEGRLARKRGADVDLDRATMPEVLDAIRTAEIRRAVYAPRRRRFDVRGERGGTLICVAPGRDVAQIVSGRPTRSSVDVVDSRNWRAHVASMLAKIPKDEEAALLGGAEIRNRLLEVRNQLEQTRTEAERLKRGGRAARNLRRHADERVAELRSRESFESDRLKRLVRSTAYRHGVDHLLIECTRSRENEAYCFGDAA
jgi:hypothetical protein